MNVFLILFQRPEATRVAGYTTWQKLGRQVRCGETGITIFAPAPFKQTATDTETAVRRGNLLRVYLHRPWLVSGPGELLGELSGGGFQTLGRFVVDRLFGLNRSCDFWITLGDKGEEFLLATQHVINGDGIHEAVGRGESYG